MAQSQAYLLEDSIWEMNENFNEWNTDNILQWIELLNEEFDEQYSEYFSLKAIDGSNFTRKELGDPQWCCKELNMDQGIAEKFSAIVCRRIKNYENMLASKLPKKPLPQRPLPKKPLPKPRLSSGDYRIKTCCIDVGRGPMRPLSNTIGLSVGGAKDINNFRECIKNNIKPSVSSITYNGLFYEYYFDTTTTKHSVQHNNDDNIDDDGSTLFYPSYCFAKIRKQIFNIVDNEEELEDMKDDHQFEYYLSVGLNSNIKQDEFKRKHLNLVIVLDESGSMNCKLDFMDHQTKMQVANQSVNALLAHLTHKDRFGMVVFHNECSIIQPIKFVKDINMNELQNKISSITARGGTNFEAGYNGAIDLYKTLFDDNEYKLNAVDDDYENRIIFLTDAQPNHGNIDRNTLLHLAANYADGKIEEKKPKQHMYPTPVKNVDDVKHQQKEAIKPIKKRIYTTFIGVGLDFNSSLIETISSTRGCNYYSVQSIKAFKDVMDEDFEYMVTPLVFSVVLKLKCEGNDCVIEKVYGSNNDGDEDKKKEEVEVTRINTLFPSKKSEESGETKGGMQLIKLKKTNQDKNNEDINVEIEVEFEDRSGKKYTNVQFISLKIPPNQDIVALNDMIEKEQDDDYECVNFYDNNGIRKAILLCKYVELMKDWSQSSNDENAKYKLCFERLLKHFKHEMNQCEDDTLQKEIDLIQTLIDADMKLTQQVSYSAVSAPAWLMPDI